MPLQVVTCISTLKKVVLVWTEFDIHKWASNCDFKLAPGELLIVASNIAWERICNPQNFLLVLSDWVQSEVSLGAEKTATVVFTKLKLKISRKKFADTSGLLCYSLISLYTSICCTSNDQPRPIFNINESLINPISSTTWTCSETTYFRNLTYSFLTQTTCFKLLTRFRR